LLREQWGFKGITISDHGAIKELIKHGVAADARDAVRLAITSGVDMSMSDEFYDKYLPGLVKDGLVPESDIDRACRDVLNTKYDMGLFK
ncbi:glycoside hydrolase family 3 N-terminal domain-containing protein, partial [Klebsiella aerogenes]